MTNSVLSDTFKSSVTRLLIIDDHQLRYNQILDIFRGNGHQVHATLLDDLSSFEKQLNFEWDLVIFARAYDLKIQQTVLLIQASKQANLPLLMFSPEGYQPQDYAQYIQRGVYELVDLEHTQHFYIAASRALAYSRLLQNKRRLGNELQLAQSHAQNLVQERNSATAIIEEGIHVSANAGYLELFGLSSEDELMGLPLLDLLQPDDLNAFKQRFKKIIAGQFEQAQFEIHSLNTHLHAANPLKLEFLASDEEDCLQISIETRGDVSATFANAQSNHTSHALNAITPKYMKVNDLLKEQQGTYHALLLITLEKCPDLVFQDDWHTFKNYFSNTLSFLKDNLPIKVIRIESAVFVAIVSAQSPMLLQQNLSQLAKFEKPQLVNVNNTTMPLHLRLSWYSLKSAVNDAEHLESLMAQAFNQRLPNITPSTATQENTVSSPPEQENLTVVRLTAEHIEQAKAQTPLLFDLEHALQKNEIVLKYQQIYDKQDSNLYIYEVFAGFSSQQGWHNLNDLNDLNDDADLSIQIDRWILVEACKQLHKFIQNNPAAKLIINLNQHILYQDLQFAELITKLLTIVASKQDHPLVLQFSEQAVMKNLAVASQQFEILSREGAELSIRNAGANGYTEQILKATKLHFLTLAEKLSHKLSTEQDLEWLQQQVDAYLALQPIEILLRELNDMNMFANAWSVNARYLQGDYFQKKMERLIDVQQT